MTGGEILFWIFIAILLVLLYKISSTVFWVVLIIAFIIFILRIFNNQTVQHFQPVENAVSYSSYTSSASIIDQNYDDFSIPVQDCSIPNSISEYCVHKRIQEHGDIDLAISQCVPPAPTSALCVGGICAQ